MKKAKVNYVDCTQIDAFCHRLLYVFICSVTKHFDMTPGISSFISQSIPAKSLTDEDLTFKYTKYMLNTIFYFRAFRMKVKHDHKALLGYLQVKLTYLTASYPASIDSEEFINAQMSGGKNQRDAVLPNQTDRLLE